MAGSGVGVRKNSNFKKYEHVIYHFEARDLDGDSVNVILFERHLNFAKIQAKQNFAKFLEVFIKSRNLNISRK